MAFGAGKAETAEKGRLMKAKAANFPFRFNYLRSIGDLRARRVRLKPIGLKELRDLRTKLKAIGNIR